MFVNVVVAVELPKEVEDSTTIVVAVLDLTVIFLPSKVAVSENTLLPSIPVGTASAKLVIVPKYFPPDDGVVTVLRVEFPTSWYVLNVGEIDMSVVSPSAPKMLVNLGLDESDLGNWYE